MQCTESTSTIPFKTTLRVRVQRNHRVFYPFQVNGRSFVSGFLWISSSTTNSRFTITRCFQYNRADTKKKHAIQTLPYNSDVYYYARRMSDGYNPPPTINTVTTFNHVSTMIRNTFKRINDIYNIYILYVHI